LELKAKNKIMGDIKRKRKLFSRPKKLFDRVRMDEEDLLVKKYGLKNKKEIWKAKSYISKLRRRAKNLIGSDSSEQKIFFEKLNKIGIKVLGTSDVLALTEEDLLNRRLQSFILKKELANSPKQARQLIVHKNVLVDGSVVNIPSFLVKKNLEDKILLKERKNKIRKKVSKVVIENQIDEKPKEDIKEIKIKGDI
tara:strand:- start:18419 stop:19003 length:585 start_codon:yes stop_codon:yes gene_type:complete